MTESHAWPGLSWGFWDDITEVRSRLAAGADPDADLGDNRRPLHLAAEWGSAAVVAELAALTSDVDAMHDGRTALWIAVQARNAPHARALAAAGADPWRPMMGGWSPGRLSLAGPTPDLFTAPAGTPDPSPGPRSGSSPGPSPAFPPGSSSALSPAFPPGSSSDLSPAFPPGSSPALRPGLSSSGLSSGLSPAEAEAAQEAHRLITALGSFDDDGDSFCCVSGLTAREAINRLGGVVIDYEEPDDPDYDDDNRIVAVTDVPGGCVLSQRYGFLASTPGVSGRLSADTVCYAMYANPKSGNQGSIMRDGSTIGSDLHPGGGWSAADDPPAEILHTYLYRGHSVAYCCFYAGLRLTDPRPFTGTPDYWVELPDRDWWIFP
ncbi:ankyrin repeat domain-containing protein [Actinoplanes sp. NBC_00393]|uniref:ankyrin repeat domain-containing protein n=1 Tax=Actinoplanes sp. NBC_00393 TaxID=2975953 RepID=UPI002E1B167B